MLDAAQQDRVREAWQVLLTVLDPEVPVLSVVDLGIVRDVRWHEDSQRLQVVLTPTYSGCPATELITCNVQAALEAAGYPCVDVSLQRAPAWTTDWISEAGRDKLKAYGIAPPLSCSGSVAPQAIRLMARGVACPRCGSALTERLSAFGATACKSLYRCCDCLEPFEYFKPI